MTWSYSGNPMATVGDAVRFEIQDVFSTAPLVQDEEITWVLSQETDGTPYSMNDIWRAAAHVCETLVRRFSMQADSELGSLKLTYSKQALGFDARAKDLRLRAQGTAAPFVGGQSISDKRARASDQDAVEPAFHRGQFDNPWAGESQGYGTDDLGLFPED